jgi:hypothetical protein
MTDEETLAAERCAARLLEARALLAAIDEGELFADAPAGAAARPRGGTRSAPACWRCCRVSSPACPATCRRYSAAAGLSQVAPTRRDRSGPEAVRGVALAFVCPEYLSLVKICGRRRSSTIVGLTRPERDCYR